MWFGDPEPRRRGKRLHLSLVTHSWSRVGPAGTKARPLGQVSLPGDICTAGHAAVASGDPKTGEGEVGAGT